MDINWSNLATDIQISVQTETDFKRYTFYWICTIFKDFTVMYLSVLKGLMTVLFKLAASK